VRGQPPAGTCVTLPPPLACPAAQEHKLILPAHMTPTCPLLLTLPSPPVCIRACHVTFCRYVQEVDRGYVWVTFSPAIRGRAFATQVRCACLPACCL
jgi:hypothetical protein